MSRKKIESRYEDFEPTITRDRDLTPEEISEYYEKHNVDNTEVLPVVQTPKLKGILKVACGCGCIANVSDEVIEDGLSWSMIIGNNHHLTLKCMECGAELKMYIEEIKDTDELPEESNKN